MIKQYFYIDNKGFSISVNQLENHAFTVLRISVLISICHWVGGPPIIGHNVNAMNILTITILNMKVFILEDTLKTEKAFKPDINPQLMTGNQFKKQRQTEQAQFTI